ncbi:MAG: ATP-binding cassette domain-containing protein, partial [Acidimicrobiales bacterium]|nr:ATP-binding cassette domain-containing protein [Acidimicrobiales bacterium]
MSIVSVHGLTIRYGDLVAVDGVDLEVNPGEIVVLAGANGAGKTSTVEAIEGYRVPSGGEVRIAGLGPTAALDAGLAGVLLQDDGIYPGA